MRKSSAKLRQSELDFGSADESSGPGVLDGGSETPEAGRASSTTGGVSFPDFSGPTDLYAIASRRAGRLNAANIPDKEVQDFLDERQRLLDKKFDGTLKRADEIRLQYVRWCLARVEDARYGESLDRLESWITEYERLGERIDTLSHDLGESLKRGRR